MGAVDVVRARLARCALCASTTTAVVVCCELLLLLLPRSVLAIALPPFLHRWPSSKFFHLPLQLIALVSDIVVLSLQPIYMSLLAIYMSLYATNLSFCHHINGGAYNTTPAVYSSRAILLVVSLLTSRAAIMRRRRRRRIRWLALRLWSNVAISTSRKPSSSYTLPYLGRSRRSSMLSLSGTSNERLLFVIPLAHHLNPCCCFQVRYHLAVNVA